MADQQGARNAGTRGPEGAADHEHGGRPGTATGLRPVTRCPHGRVVHWGDHGPDPRDGTVGAEVCVACSAPVAELRRALERIAALTGDVRVRRIAQEALARTGE